MRLELTSFEALSDIKWMNGRQFAMARGLDSAKCTAEVEKDSTLVVSQADHHTVYTFAPEVWRKK